MVIQPGVVADRLRRQLNATLDGREEGLEQQIGLSRMAHVHPAVAPPQRKSSKALWAEAGVMSQGRRNSELHPHSFMASIANARRRLLRGHPKQELRELLGEMHLCQCHE